ncbi:MAG: hypothetical protein Q9170_007903 [Blastenia crenularia]
MTLEQVTAKIVKSKATKKDLGQSRSINESDMRTIQEEQAKVKSAQEMIRMEITRMCISERNAYSKRAIAQDYATGIRELDQELGFEENEIAFDPDVETRDYKKIAQDLPVFCVSSRGYQKLMGRFEQDDPVLGFKAVAETEIPLLQKHCTKITEAGRIAKSQRFLKALLQQFEDLMLYVSPSDTVVQVTEEQKTRAEQLLASSLEKPKSDLDSIIKSAIDGLWEDLSTSIINKYERAVSDARIRATVTPANWGGLRKDGGYAYPTYRAICLRSGVYSNAQGNHDWNQVLAEPLIKNILPGWEKAFFHQLPKRVRSFAWQVSDVLKTFHEEIDARFREVGCSTTSIGKLSQQLNVYNDKIEDAAGTVICSIDTSQKRINREFAPIIQEILRSGYKACSKERGPDCFMRMKILLQAEISKESPGMFQASVDHVKTELIAMIKIQENILRNKVAEVLQAIQRDCIPVLSCSEAPQSIPLKSSLKGKLLEILYESEEIFERIARPLRGDDINNNTVMDSHYVATEASTPMDMDLEILQGGLRDIPMEDTMKNADQGNEVQARGPGSRNIENSTSDESMLPMSSIAS